MIRKYSSVDFLVFGKHKGKTVREIVEADPTYLNWLLDSIPEFYIAPEDMLELIKLNQAFTLADRQRESYLKKKAQFELENIMQEKSIDQEFWGLMKTTRKNSLALKVLQPILDTYRLAEFGTLFVEARHRNAWQGCELAVDSTGCPMIRVYAEQSRIFPNKSQELVESLRHTGLFTGPSSPNFMVEVNMDSPVFGVLAYRLVNLGLLKANKMNKSTVPNNKA
jgi:hypothetical protein